MLRKGFFFIITFIAISLILSLLTFEASDSPKMLSNFNQVPKNLLGQPGVYISSQFFILFGKPAFFFILLILLTHLSLFVDFFYEKRLKRLFGVFLAIFSVSFYIVMTTNDLGYEGGGIIAGVLDGLIKKGFGLFGEIVLFVFMITSSLLLICDIPPGKLFDYAGNFTEFLKKMLPNSSAKRTDNKKPPFFRKVTIINQQDEDQIITDYKDYYHDDVEPGIELNKEDLNNSDVVENHEQSDEDYDLLMYEKNMVKGWQDSYDHQEVDSHSPEPTLNEIAADNNPVDPSYESENESQNQESKATIPETANRLFDDPDWQSETNLESKQQQHHHQEPALNKHSNSFLLNHNFSNPKQEQSDNENRHLFSQNQKTNKNKKPVTASEESNLTNSKIAGQAESKETRPLTNTIILNNSNTIIIEKIEKTERNGLNEQTPLVAVDHADIEKSERPEEPEIAADIPEIAADMPEIAADIPEIAADIIEEKPTVSNDQTSIAQNPGIFELISRKNEQLPVWDQKTEQVPLGTVIENPEPLTLKENSSQNSSADGLMEIPESISEISVPRSIEDSSIPVDEITEESESISEPLSIEDNTPIEDIIEKSEPGSGSLIVEDDTHAKELIKKSGRVSDPVTVKDDTHAKEILGKSEPVLAPLTLEDNAATNEITAKSEPVSEKTEPFVLDENKLENISVEKVIETPEQSMEKMGLVTATEYELKENNSDSEEQVQKKENDNENKTTLPIALLKPNEYQEQSASEDKDLEYEIMSGEKEVSLKLEKTLMEFGIEVKVVNVTRGPVITRYEVLPAPGIKVSKIVGLQDNLALVLAASKIRIIAPIPGKSVVGIEIPNKTRENVTLDEILQSLEYKTSHYHLPIVLGKTISGRPVIYDLVTMPHLLIAGSTGSGKSVFVNSLICSLLYAKTPVEARFLMIDPKRVELKMYDEIPYLLAPVITEPKKAVITLKWAVNEMEDRYKMLERYNCRDIRRYNKKIAKLKKKDPNLIIDPPLEYMVIIIDEFADLMMVCGKEVEGYVSRLAAMARAVGIHLVLATQRPSVDVITGLIKANFPARIAFQVSSKTESRIILDGNGAEKLLGKGDFLFTAPGQGELSRVQGVFLTDDEVYELTAHLKSLGKPNYIPELESIETSDASNSMAIEDEPLFREAVEIILADRKASASYLQRKMRIGYNRAARLIELLEQEGIVSPAQGSKPRDILVESY